MSRAKVFLLLLLLVLATGCSSYAAAPPSKPSGFCSRHPDNPKCQSPSPSPSPSPPPSSPPVSSPPPSSPPPSSPPPGSWSCTKQGAEQSCGPYVYPGITNSNGYNTYVNTDCWANPQCTSKVESNNPGQWQVTTREAAGNTSVRSYPDAQQLMNNWDPQAGNWVDCANRCAETPISALASLSSTYTEVTPRGGTIAQFAWDIWTGNNSGPSEIMVWVDNSQRGSGGATQVGTATIAGQAWTIYRYGNTELIWSLGAPGTFLQQGSGTVDLLAILQESIRQGLTSPGATLSQVNAGWEVCSTGGVDQTFSLSRYTLSGAGL